MKFESLNEYQETLLIEEALLLEGFNFSDIKNLKNPMQVMSNLLNKVNNTVNKRTKLSIIRALIFLTAYTSCTTSEIAKIQAADEEISEIGYEMIEVSAPIEQDAIYNATKKLAVPKDPNSIEMNADRVAKMNAIVPNRFSIRKLDQYNKYDVDIYKAVEELKAAGQTPNVKLIKAIMVIETGMIPRKNHLGYRGFPQTKMKIVRGINKRFGTNFSKDDLYNAKESAKFIHYMITAIKKSKYVKWDREAVAAYNWGLGNFSKYRLGLKKMPKETSEYVKMINEFVK